jgi:hypothetical protein
MNIFKFDIRGGKRLKTIGSDLYDVENFHDTVCIKDPRLGDFFTDLPECIPFSDSSHNSALITQKDDFTDWPRLMYFCEKETIDEEKQ